jgi:chemotaxis protein MotB
MSMIQKRATALAATLALALPLFTGCASQRVVNDYEEQIMRLQEERTDLKKRNRDLQGQIQNYEVAVGQLNTELSELSEATMHTGAIDPELAGLGIDQFTRGGNPVFSLPQAVSFASGSSNLTDQGKRALDGLAAVLNREYGDAYYWIEGHTDSDPIKKSGWDSNRDLSLARAMAVLHYLVEETGVLDDDCVVVGHGQYSPLAQNDTNEHKALNRRVEVIVKR